MEAFVICVVAGILCAAGVISHYIFLAVCVSSVVLMYACVWLYCKFGFLKSYYHDILGWHRPDDSPQQSDGCSIHSKCKYCGKDIMQDSQGNWF